ncbi:MAG: carbohydrate binding family 9 domain-containing protein, partial [Gemmatimonadetes bacterium]|nr:carbohydrate binding family 9 domain-containing protein [Gemmatimonadota bacterium]
MLPRDLGRASFGVCLMLALAAARGAAQTQAEEREPPRAMAAAAGSAPVIDGRLDDASWSAAPVIGSFVQHEPYEGRPASERTEVRILFDRDAVYVGAWLFDTDPSAIVRGETRRDATIEDTDAFMVVLDTYLDRQNAFVFGTTPAGIEYDGQVTREGTGGGLQSVRAQGGAAAGFNLNWDGSWEVATSRDEGGWYAEFRIPFATIRYGGGGPQRWGLNLARHIRRRNEQAYWSPVGRQFNLWRISGAGTLQGVVAPTRHPVDVTPFALNSAARDYRATTSWPDECRNGRPTCRYNVGSLRGEFASGLDAKIGVTPSLSLDLTYNTDFAQVEVDEQQVNLTRFNLFFPEKRPFFLENAGLFSVGSSAQGGGQSVEMFFSRRLGIGPGGVLVPIVGGGRLTGRLGGMNVGLLDLVTEEVGAVPANNYAVARLVRELPNRSRVGAMVLSRSATAIGGDYNRTYLADGRWGIGEALNVDAFAAITRTPTLSGREHAASVTGSYATRNWRWTATFTEVGDNFNPEVGFLERSGYRLYSGMLMRHLRFPALPWFRELRPHVSYRGWFDFDGFNETANIHFDSHIQFANGAFVSPAMNITREGLKEPFDIAPGITVAADTYDHLEAA